MYKKRETPLAKAFVYPQPYPRLYSPAEALMKGTIFPNLYQPYKPEKPYR